MHAVRSRLLCGLFAVLVALPASAQNAAVAAPRLTEQREHPYSIDLLPDDPAPPPFEAAPETAAAIAAGEPDTRKTITGDFFDRWLSTEESGITFGDRVTQFGFGLADGVDRPVPPPVGDGNPNPIQYFLSTGLGGFSPLGRQRGDTFGLGWFLVGTSTQFGPVPSALFGPRPGMGLEWFYNVQATPWLNITPDLQWIRPGLGAISTDNAFVYGMRANATF